MKTLLAFVFALFCSSVFAIDGARITAKYTSENEEQRTAWGTCFAISENQVLTAYHTVTRGTLLVETDAGWIKAKIIRFDKDVDICLIETAVPHGLKVFAIHQQGGINVSGSLKGDPIEDKVGFLDEVRIRVRCAPGVSGGPIVENNKIIGMMIMATDPIDGEKDMYGTAICISASRITEFLNRKKVP